MYFERFDIAEAHYQFTADYHDGQTSKLYEKFAQLDRIGFHPRPNLSYETLTVNGLVIYTNLVLNRD